MYLTKLTFNDSSKKKREKKLIGNLVPEEGRSQSMNNRDFELLLQMKERIKKKVKKSINNNVQKKNNP